MRAIILAGSLLLTSIVFAACRTAEDSDPIPRGLPGTYAYEAKGRSGGEAWAFQAELELAHDGRYQLLSESYYAGYQRRDVERGHYVVRGRAVLLDNEDDGRFDVYKANRLEITGGYTLRAEFAWGASGAMYLLGMRPPTFVRRARIRD
jgi:hypothetical protein